MNCGCPENFTYLALGLDEDDVEPLRHLSVSRPWYESILVVIERVHLNGVLRQNFRQLLPERIAWLNIRPGCVGKNNPILWMICQPLDILVLSENLQGICLSPDAPHAINLPTRSRVVCAEHLFLLVFAL